MTEPPQFFYTNPLHRPVSRSYSMRVTPGAVLPVTPNSDPPYRTVIRVPVPGVLPGDTLHVDARWRCTNDLTYNVGVGCHLWAYDDSVPYDSTTNSWWRIGPWTGDNVDRQRHHMPMYLSTDYQVPDDWSPGHSFMVLVRADAMSDSSAREPGDVLSIDEGYGHISVERWTFPV